MAERFPSVHEMVERLENSQAWPQSTPPVASDINAKATRTRVYAHVPPVQYSTRTEATTHISYQDDFNQQLLEQFMSTLRMEEFEAPPAVIHHAPGTGTDAFNFQPSSRTHAPPALQPPTLPAPAPTRPVQRSSQPVNRLTQPAQPRADNWSPHLPLPPAQPTPIYHNIDEFPSPLAWQNQPLIPRQLHYTESLDYDSVFSPDDSFVSGYDTIASMEDLDDEEPDVLADLLSVTLPVDPILNPQAYSTPAVPLQVPIPPAAAPVPPAVTQVVPPTVSPVLPDVP